MNKLFLIILSCLLLLTFPFIEVRALNTLENPLRPYIDNGEGYGVVPGDPTPTKTPSEQVREKQSSIVKDIFKKLFGNSSNLTPLPTNTLLPQNTPIPTNSNLLPTGAYPTITYFPPVDPNNILNDTNLVYPESILANVKRCLANKQLYEIAASHTGIPWMVIAAVHYTETGGSCGTDKSSVSGRTLGTNEPDLAGECSSQRTGLGIPKALTSGGCGFDNLLDSLVYTGNHLKQKNTRGQADGIPRSHQELLLMVSNYNGGGNSNCLGGTPYRFCPPLFERDDDTYVNNKKPSSDGRYDPMYIRYCADRKLCSELGISNPVHQVYGVLTVAGALSKL